LFLHDQSIDIINHDFGEFVDTLVVALREMEKAENPVSHIHPVIVR
jgi:hypothetical protein